MLWTGLILAALVAATPPQQAATPGRAAPPAAAESGANSRANGIVCETRPVTGSRLNQRRCRSRADAATDRAQAQEFAGQIQAGNASRPELVLDGGPR